ncbi:MAG: hypothetical protein ABIF77_05190 [bacterium]
MTPERPRAAFRPVFILGVCLIGLSVAGNMHCLPERESVASMEVQSAAVIPVVPLVFAQSAAHAQPAAQAREADGTQGNANRDNPAIRDPFFEWIVGIIEDDELGTWNQTYIQAMIFHAGRESKLPLEHFISIVRREAAADEMERRRGVDVTRIWEITLTDNLKLSMPYSILGYHPGSLFLARNIRLSEWRLGNRDVHVVRDETTVPTSVTGLAVFRLDTGWVVLDVDGWLDRLLGKKLDDSWMVGFAVGRVGEEVKGLGMAESRQGRRLYGEIDFREDKILPHGRPVARAMSSYCRAWTRPPQGVEARVWIFE